MACNIVQTSDLCQKLSHADNLAGLVASTLSVLHLYIVNESDFSHIQIQIQERYRFCTFVILLPLILISSNYSMWLDLCLVTVHLKWFAITRQISLQYLSATNQLPKPCHQMMACLTEEQTKLYARDPSPGGISH
jgi:hypothetical protein